ncbi:hypothetical protein FM110_07365 [Brachybacterium nesterenkovii]|uniref:Uncharacterized protein n=1 Tax=Brachybacterium nesterenkovii TaxID=47847 RepID=A0A1X6X2K7_9MICO|nr:hypothetical protein FM110_07365 [Brachybacterium nesterenkovii]
MRRSASCLGHGSPPGVGTAPSIIRYAPPAPTGADGSGARRRRRSHGPRPCGAARPGEQWRR